MKFKIANREIGRAYSPFVIAEMSGNHNQSLDRAFEIVAGAANSGVHALKLQTYRPDTITLDVKEGEFFIEDKNSLWKGKSLYELYQEAYTPWEWHKPIMKRAKELDLLCFSSPFDETAVDFLEELDVPAYKIASPEIIHLPLLKKIAATGKPMIISTGMASIDEIDEAVCTVKKAGCKQFMLLKCTSTYPASCENSNVFTIPHMRDLFNCEVGLSDHTMGIGAAVAAVSYGASVVEKHFTLCRSDGGVDSAFSLEPEEMKTLVIETERAWQSLGKVSYGTTEDEIPSKKYRRSLYIAQDMNAGDVFTSDNLRIVRPGLGLPPKFFDVVVGRKVNQNVKKGTSVQWELVS